MKDRKILCMNAISSLGTDQFREGYTLTDDINEAHGILVRSADLHETEFPRCLRGIARAGAGFNNIPIERCAEQGIVVFNTPGANANGVKEMVVAALMLASRDIRGGMEWVRDNEDNADIEKAAEKAKKSFAGCEIAGKTLGVIGLGAIGVRVANIALYLGMNVLGYDPYISVGSAWSLKRDVRHIESLDEVFERSDYISIHVPAMDSTKGMLNREAIAKMKDGVRILNFAREQLVNEADLAEALESGKIARYVCDFPTPATVKMKNTVITPHLAASTRESEDNCAVMAARQLQDYLDNGNILHSVNFPDLDAGVCRTESRIALLHSNIPGMLGMITKLMGDENINIANLYNKSRDKYAYTLMDLEGRITDSALEKVNAIGGMCRVRIVK